MVRFNTNTKATQELKVLSISWRPQLQKKQRNQKNGSKYLDHETKTQLRNTSITLYPLISLLSWHKQDPAAYGLVMDGNIENLPEIYEKYPNVLIMIHAAGYPAVHTAYDTTREAAYMLSDYDDFRIVAVDCARGPAWGKVCYNYGIHGYPDFRFFKNGEQVDDWDGNGSDLNELIEYINTMRSLKDEL